MPDEINRSARDMQVHDVRKHFRSDITTNPKDFELRNAKNAISYISAIVIDLNVRNIL
jgi:hypothetical protein